MERALAPRCPQVRTQEAFIAEVQATTGFVKDDVLTQVMHTSERAPRGVGSSL